MLATSAAMMAREMIGPQWWSGAKVAAVDRVELDLRHVRQDTVKKRHAITFSGARKSYGQPGSIGTGREGGDCRPDAQHSLKRF